jgi:hypothetical protein
MASCQEVKSRAAPERRRRRLQRRREPAPYTPMTPGQLDLVSRVPTLAQVTL